MISDLVFQVFYLKFYGMIIQQLFVALCTGYKLVLRVASLHFRIKLQVPVHIFFGHTTPTDGAVRVELQPLEQTRLVKIVGKVFDLVCRDELLRLLQTFFAWFVYAFKK